MTTETLSGVPRADQARISRRRREILDAATKCVRRYGAKKVAVEDIAQAAGISRRSLYRFFSGRRDIMQAVVYDRLTTLAAGVKAALKLCDGFEECVLVGTVETIHRARADKIFEALVDEDRTLTLDDDPHDPAGPIKSLSNSIWADVFETARSAGDLRPTITNEEALEWLIEVHRLFDMRHDLTDVEITDVLRKFVLPSLVPDERIGKSQAAERPTRRA
jgi:AcrR family transcriptional regulator